MNDGYSYQTRSANHNTILVNNVGQLVVGRMKEGYKFNQPGSGDMTQMGVVTTFKEFGKVVVIEGEASGSYPKSSARPALNQFRRIVIWNEGKYILIVDAIKANEDAQITWLLQSKKVNAVDQKNGEFSLVNDGVSLTSKIASDPELEYFIGKSTADNRGKNLG